MHISNSSTTGDAPWVSVATVGIGAFALVTTEFLPVGLLPQIATELSLSEGQTGLMVTLPGLFAALTAPLILAWANAFDRRHVLAALLALLALSNVTVAMASDLWVLLLGRAMLGVAVGGFWTIGVTLGARLKPARAAKATSIIFSGVSLGTVAGVPAGTLLGQLIGWRWVFTFAAVLAVLVTIMLLRVLPRLPAQSSAGLSALRGVLSIRMTKIGLVAILLIFIGQFSAYTYLSPYLINIAGTTPAVLSMILLGFGAAGFLGNLLGGWAITKSIPWTVIFTTLLMGLPMLLLATAPASPAVMIFVVMIWGLGFGLLPIAMQSWLFSMAPDRLEAMGAIFVSTAQVSIGMGALIGGVAVDHFGVLTTLALGGALAVLATLVIAIAQGIRETSRKSSAQVSDHRECA